MKRALLLTVVMAVIALCGACASKEKRPRPEPVTQFNTHISADGTKLFVYRMEMPERESGGGQRGRPQGGGMGGRGAPPAQERGSGRGERGNDDDLLKQQVDLLIAQNRYCRNGYLVLDQYTGAGGSSLRGECREEASAEDRTRFPNP